PQVEESGSMVGGDLTVDLNPGNNKGTVDVTVAKKSGSTPRVRSKGNATVTGGAPLNYVSDGGEVKVRDAGGVFTASYDATKVKVNDPQGEQPGDPFYQMAWNEVKKADSSDSTLAGGVYVWWDDGTLHYFDMSYDDYVNSKPTGAGAAAVLPAGVTVTNDKGKMKMKLTQDLYIGPSKAGIQDLAIIPREGALEIPAGDPDAPAGGTPAAVLSSLPAPTSYDGAGRTYWTVPISAAGNVSIDAGGYSPADFGLFLTDNGDGTGTVLLRDTNWDFCSPSTPGDLSGPFALLESNANFTGFSSQFQTLLTLLSSGAGPNGEVDIPGVDDQTTASDLEIEFKPATKGGSIVLTSDGDVRLTGAVKGQGGSITAGGEIRITGLGADFASGTTGDDVVNMYAVGDIVFSSLDETTPGAYEFRDVKLKGVVYTQGDFVARLGSEALAGKWGKFDLEGVLIAYGGDPSSGGNPGQGGKGKVDIRAEEVKMAFDPVYIGALATKLPAKFQLRAISWTNNP
ncbi:MAG: hypothetical protein AB1758_25290, partial [Candidatus Eremiobacterota bacterium]